MKRKALSNLIGTIILISATLIGGVLVYNYFQKSMTTMENMGQNVFIMANSQIINSNSQIIYIKITNNMQGQIKIIGIYGIYQNGTQENLTLTSNNINPDIINKYINSGETVSFVIYASSNIQSIFLQYNDTQSNVIMSSQPVNLK
ncbi:archaellin/type IV pilin N-terminal domain-containing protein [Caldisphaera lagunensis]|nr:archaellin/type IV pilin N-terminal domain-containing protein [Caldisphaera lagunensis]